MSDLGRAALSCVLLTALLLIPTGVWSHAFVIRSDPRTGATLAEPPSRVRIWFDGPVEPLFIDLRVEDEGKQRADNGGGRLNPRDNTLIEVGLRRLAPGRYRVFWGVIARDGHRREGNFSFLVK